MLPVFLQSLLIGALMAAALFFFLSSLAYAQAPELPGWKLVWSDEFNYTGHPDPAKWGYEEGYVQAEVRL